MNDNEYRRLVREGLAPLVDDVSEGPDWSEFVAVDVVVTTTPVSKTLPRWLIAVLGAMVVLVLGSLPLILSPRTPPSTSNPVVADPPTTVPSTGFAEPPVLDQETASYVFLSTDQQLTAVDVDSASVLVNDVPELAPGDALYRLVRRGEAFAFYGETTTSPAVFVMDPIVPTDPVLLDEAWFFVPSAVQDRVWLAILDESSPETIRALESVREVALDGQVTVEDVPPPNGRWPVASLLAGLVFQGDETLDVWDPRSQQFVATLPGPFPVAAWQNRLVTCESCDELHLADLDARTERTIDLPVEVGFVDGYGGAFSPDGKYVAVPGYYSDYQPIPADTPVGIVLIDFESGSASVVPGMSHALSGYPQVSWSTDGNDCTALNPPHPDDAYVCGNQRLTKGGRELARRTSCSALRRGL